MGRISLRDTTFSSVLVIGLVLLIVADAHGTIPTTCPKEDPKNGTVKIGHETDCTKYYVCWSGMKVEMECPIMDAEGNRLHFNPVLQVCDWPCNVDCKLPLPSIRIASFAPKVTVPTECPRVDTKNDTVHLAHEHDCTKFYKCIYGDKYEMQCPVYNDKGDRLYFNATVQVCDWPYNVDCKLPLPSIRIASFAPKVTIPTECPRVDSKNDTVHLAHKSDCTKFYKCIYGQKYEMQCPIYNGKGDRLYFNATVQVCDWPYNVDCKLPLPSIRIASFAPKVTIPTECPRVDPVNDTIHLAHENDCTKFYKCSYGEKYEMQCPVYNSKGDRLYFNVTAQVCDWPYNVDCKLPLPKRVISLLATIDPYPTKCPAGDWQNETVLLPDDTDCTKYYMCSGGKKYSMQCPFMNDEGDRLYFNPVTHGCDWPDNVDCQQPETIVRTLELDENPVVPTECPPVDSLNVTIHLEYKPDCTKFYKCNAGQKVLMNCPRGLYFNKYLQVCDWPWNVKCSNTEPTTPSTRPTPEPTTPSTLPTPEPTTPSTLPTPEPTTPSTLPTPEPTTPSTLPTPEPTTPSTLPTPEPTTPSTLPTPEPTTPSTLPTPEPTTPSTLPPLPAPDKGCIGTCPNNDPPNKITPLPNIDCRKWCRCENRKIMVFTCPADFHFSTELKKCTKPELANCKRYRYPQRSQATNEHDEALMNILGYNERFVW